MSSLPVAGRPRRGAVVGALLLVIALAASSPAGAAMPPVVTQFQGQGLSLGGPCAAGSTCSSPADPVGAASANYYVQTTNINGSAGLAIWNKSGTLVAAAKHLDLLWSGYVGTNAGNGCASRNDGDAIVRYDQLADRWVVIQWSLPNYPNGPSFECVAVSKTGDPTGAWWLYDFSYSFGLLDQAKLAVWPDAYYVTGNAFDSAGTYKGVEVCAWDRASMLAGQPATQRCALTSTNEFAYEPASVDGSTPPPQGSPEYLMSLDANGAALDYRTATVDWTTQTPLTLSARQTLTVDAFANPCTGAPPPPNCIPQPGSTTTLDTQAGWLMDRLAYRNFGDHQSIVAAHTVQGGAGAAIRWYELRLAGNTPSVYQQGTFAPSDANWRWMPSIAQDRSGDIMVGYSVSSTGSGTNAVSFPSLAWAGRLAGDPAGTLGQGEAITKTGGGVALDEFSGPPDQHRARWGDFSSLTVDPSDDCTFWFTSMYYSANGTGNWQTWVQNTKFPSCGQNAFTMSAQPASLTIAPGSNDQSTITTAVTAGSPGTIALSASGLPAGVTAQFTPSSVSAGGQSTLGLTVAPDTVAGTYPITVTGTGPDSTAGTTVTLTVSAPTSGTTTSPGSPPVNNDTPLVIAPLPTGTSASPGPAPPASAPDTILVKHPKKRVKSRRSKTTVTFTFRSPAAGATFVCALDRAPFRRCVSPARFRVRRGRHTFRVRAVVGSRADLSPAVFAFRVQR